MIKSKDLNNLEKMVLKYVNYERVRRKLRSLKWDDSLAHIARLHSEDMLKNNYFSHFNLKGEGPVERAKKYGKYRRKYISLGSYIEWVGGENIAGLQSLWGFGGDNYIAKKIVKMWMQSKGHRENMLKSFFTLAGCGIAQNRTKLLATMVFF